MEKVKKPRKRGKAERIIISPSETDRMAYKNPEKDHDPRNLLLFNQTIGLR